MRRGEGERGGQALAEGDRHAMARKRFRQTKRNIRIDGGGAVIGHGAISDDVICYLL